MAGTVELSEVVGAEGWQAVSEWEIDGISGSSIENICSDGI